MTKNDIAAELCNRYPALLKSSALNVVEGITGILADAFTRGESVFLRGFGTFEVKATKERTARNITTGTSVLVPAGRTVKLRLSKELKNRMNNGTVD